MAALTRKALKLVAVVGTIPAVGIIAGYRIRSLQATEASNSGVRRVYKVYELPMYTVYDYEKQEVDNKAINEPKNVVQEQITFVRRAVQDFFGQFTGTYEYMKTSAETGIEHSKSTLDYIQNNPGELPRVAFIAVAGMGGIVLGYRGGPLRKLAYGSIAAVSCAALSYPRKTLDMGQESLDYIKQLWKENAGEDFFEKYWPFRKDDESETSQVTPQLTQGTENIEKRLRLKVDSGQSNPADKDLYSTRSS